MPRPALTSLTFGLMLVASWLPPALAWGQTEPPPASAAPTEAAPVATPTPPPDAPVVPLGAPPAAAPAPLPGLAPVSPAPATPVAEPGALPPLPPTEDQPPLYKQTWFWALVGVVALTATMITIGIASQGPATPNTDFGNMRAY